jgi:DNA-binding NarL/FixJ family response regulator
VEQATPLSGHVDEQASEHEFGQIRALLGAGLGDDAIARPLDLGVRTVRRRIAELSAELGSRSRFQVGVLAERRGYVRGA